MLTPLMAEILRDRPYFYSPLVDPTPPSSGNTGYRAPELARRRPGVLTVGSGFAAGARPPDGYGRAWRNSSDNNLLTYASDAHLNSAVRAHTIECLVVNNTSAMDSQETILQKPFTSHNPPYYQFGLFGNTTGIHAGMAHGGTYTGVPETAFPAGISWGLGKWIHLVLTWDADGPWPGYYFGYANGKLFLSSFVSLNPISTYSTPLAIYRLYNVAGDQWPGEVCHVALYPHRLPRGRVLAHTRAAFEKNRSLSAPRSLLLPRSRAA